jgi:hypothetical protein
MALRKEGR